MPSSAAWAPFQKIKMYDIPDKIFEQYNQAQVSTMMGLFAELNHAWISIDNALYLWDYTDPNPELIGFEEQPNSITAVKLVTPRAGVFVPQISRLLVVATTSDIFLLGVSAAPTATGSKQVSLYQTRMQVSIRGISVQSIAGSTKSGRIFFAGRGDDDVYELTYQQEEKWFQNRCAKVNRTSPGYTSIVPALPFMTKAPHEFVNQLVVDDTRNVLYTLSSRSTIRVFSLKSDNDLPLCVTRTHSSILNDLGHKVGPTSLFKQGTAIVSLSAISATEASRLNLIATTSTGCRIFFSAVSSSYYGGDSGSPPTSMQVHHVKFPPKDPSKVAPQQQQPQQSGSITAFQAPPTGDDAGTLTETRLTSRLAPGYFLAFVQKNSQSSTDLLFITAPDSGRIGNVQDTTQQAKFPEFGSWLSLDSRAEDIGEVTPPFSATYNPSGFGNELAVQFDKSSTEIAVLTNSGVHTFRRRRMVDVFASAIRYGGGDEGLDGEIKNFVRIYGRGETIATAIAVACGQGSDVTADARVAKVTDPEVLERARKAFIEHGGKPVLNENSIPDQGAPAVDNVQPSPRHQGLALYISRLLRSIWRAPVVIASTSPAGGLQMTPAVPLSKLQNVQQDLTRLQEFLTANKTFIEGLAGPEALGRVSTKQEEVALQGEHRALNSLLNLISDVIEGISFVLVLFDERVEEIFMSISPESRQQVQQMTYETLFSSTQGKDLAKELVKAIVNRNIASGSNVDTVTDALRRRCGSFCSADDCVIFKAQEQLKRASDQSASSESSRGLLNESLRLLQKVAGSLTSDHLRAAVQQYISLNFYAGAIQLVLSVAQESDRGNRALSWLNDGSPSNVCLFLIAHH
jgi:nuclear pore complex protein Nup155